MSPISHQQLPQHALKHSHKYLNHSSPHINWVNYLFDEYIGLQKSNASTGAWIFRDGSYITVEAGNHRRVCEGYMGLSEKKMERWWVKIQLYCAYTHNRMTDAQKKTLNKFFKKYEDLYERNLEDW